MHVEDHQIWETQPESQYGEMSVVTRKTGHATHLDLAVASLPVMKRTKVQTLGELRIRGTANWWAGLFVVMRLLAK